MTKEDIGAVLRQLRSRAGMTQKEVAEKMGRKQQAVGHWETGYSQPDANTLFALCDLYGVSVDEAFGFQKNGITVYELRFLEKYRSLSPAARSHVDAVLQWELEHAEAIKKALTDGSAPEDGEMSIDDRVADYRRRLELEKKAEAESSVSTPAGSASTAAG